MGVVPKRGNKPANKQSNYQQRQTNQARTCDIVISKLEHETPSLAKEAVAELAPAQNMRERHLVAHQKFFHLVYPSFYFPRESGFPFAQLTAHAESLQQLEGRGPGCTPHAFLLAWQEI